MAVTNPALWRALFGFSLAGARAADLDTLTLNLFPDGIAPADFQRLLDNLRDESFSAVLQSQGWPPFAPLPGPRADIRVFGAARDRLVPRADLIATAFWYGGTPTVLPGLGHMPMLGAGADRLAAALLRWAMQYVGDRAD